MKNMLTAGLLLFAICTVQAQGYDLQWGVASKSTSADAVYAPLGWHDGNYYTLKYDGGDGFLVKFDANLTFKSEAELITGEKKFEAEMISMRNGKLLIMNSEYEKEQSATLVKAWIFTSEGKPTSTKAKVVAKFAVEKSRESEAVTYRLSADSSKILMTMDHNMPNKESAKFSVAVLNYENLEKLWATSSTVDYEDTDFGLLSSAVDNNGNVISLAVVKGGEGKKLAAYSTRAIVFSGTSGKFDDREIKIDNKYISSAFIRFGNDNKLLVSGFYNTLNNKGKSQGIEGAFIASTAVDDLVSLDLQLMEVTPTLRASITHKGWLSSDDINAYEIRDIRQHADGSGYVIAEQRAIYRDISGNQEIRTYSFNHMIIYTFDNTMNIQWITAVPKLQSTTKSAPILGIGPVAIYTWTNALTRMCYKYNSYQDIYINGTLYLLYNDHRDNGNARSNDECKNMVNKDKANGVIVAVGPDGKWEKSTLFAGKETDVILESSSCFPMPGVGFVISAEKGKDLQLGTLNIK